MSRRLPRALFVALALGVALGGCAALLPATPAAPETEQGAPPAPRRLSVREALAAPYRLKAEALERQGALREALGQWTIALTIDPGDAALPERRRALAARIEAEAAARLRQGREALARGAALEARRHFLAVLALRPGDRPALDALRNEVKDVPFVTHTVRAGDTLASIAQRYYGDRSRSEVIWETNKLPPKPQLAVGTTLRIPQIPGVPFTTTAPPAPAVDSRGAPAREEVRPELDPLLAEARDALDSREYAVALASVGTVLASNPRNAEGLDLKKAILYGLGKSQFEQDKYEESYRALSELAKLAPAYEDSADLLQQLRARLVLQHYRQGLRFYREEKLQEAIAEWRAVLAIDPRHANARKNIEQAELILKKLERLRK